ncbi:MAG: PorV/PorQ family protein [Elusimicrobiota bacterium]
MKSFTNLSVLFVVMVYICVNVCYSSFSGDDAGTTSAQFLKIGVGARAIGMGEAYGAISDDVNAIYWNPAGLNKLSGKEASLMHCIWFEDINYEHVAYAQPTKMGIFGGAINYLSMNGIEKYNNQGNASGEKFTPTDLAITISYAVKMENISLLENILLGANLKYISSTIDDASASAVALDIGGIYDKLQIANRTLQIGLVFQNIGTSMKFSKEDCPLPMNIKVGSAYTLELGGSPLLIGLDINVPIDNEIRANLGVEYTRSFKEEFKIGPRLGYKTNNKELGGLSGLSVGVGFGFRRYGFDYAWVPYGDLGITHCISISAKF